LAIKFATRARRRWAAAILAGVCAAGPAAAQREEILITGLKKAAAQSLQDAPVSAVAFGANELDARHVRSLTTLSFASPNVALEDIGTTPGTANFTIRGLGVNSSIPSIDPSVGVFVDGVYLGVNAGVVLDTFDLETVEVLRGPQGLLFGRNVTGGAVLVNTTAPNTEAWSVDGRAAVASGLEKTLSARISGPLAGDRLAIKAAAYLSDDDGYFTNQFDGEPFGEDRTAIFRAAITAQPLSALEITAHPPGLARYRFGLGRYERGLSEGDGPAAQNRGFFDRDTFDFSIDERGLHDNEWDQAIVEADLDVGFGDGVVTNIFGWRRYDQDTLADIDSTPEFIFHSATFLRQEQISNELRYAGRFANRVDLAAGVYAFTQDIVYQETRVIPIAPPAAQSQYGGGVQSQTTLGVFGQADIDLAARLTATLGLRGTYERKRAAIGTVRPLGVPVLDPLALPDGACNVLAACLDPVTGADALVRDRESWANLTPKIGLQWRASDDVQVYGFWTRGFRSGGYNLRNTVAESAAIPFDEERQNSLEIGAKAQTWDGRLRLSAAAFYNDVRDLQREVNVPDPDVGVLQVIANTADATILGFEWEAAADITDSLSLTAALGYVDGSYDTVRFDLNGDGVVDGADRALRLPRLAPLTYSVGAQWVRPAGAFEFAGRVDFSSRDPAAYTDNNAGLLNGADMLSGDLSLAAQEGRIVFSVFGQNLLNEATEGGDTQLPFFPDLPGDSFSPLNRGRIIGGEIRYRY